MRQAIRGSIVFASALCVVAAASAQTEYHDQVRLQLGAFESALLEGGFEQTHEFHIDALEQGADGSFSVTLRDDMDYQIVSVCDADCTDLDLYLYDENDNLISEDETVDDIPVMAATPRWTGRFRIRAAMFACNTDICYFGIGVFGRPR